MGWLSDGNEALRWPPGDGERWQAAGRGYKRRGRGRVAAATVAAIAIPLKYFKKVRQNRLASKSNARGKGDLIPSIDRPTRLVSPGTLLAAQLF
ncbi:hypothetical protein E2562_027679 [Oryza meyeriana var. granulata]|uniref:Uncharacterized protein n=1 Tax=Oryza meyeriana var. granulata TaxID=110450 RepID=A0A6G1EQF5_9ORYZ|nr:hypothetical protein E2562_027679 [Oryza meyeriana var. granulata]